MPLPGNETIPESRELPDRMIAITDCRECNKASLDAASHVIYCNVLDKYVGKGYQKHSIPSNCPLPKMSSILVLKEEK